MVVENGNGARRIYTLIRGYTLLVLGVGLVIYGLIASKPAVFTLGGGLIGLNPVIKAAL